MATFTIYTEGKADVKFLIDILNVKFKLVPDKLPKELAKECRIEYTIGDNQVVLLSLGGIGKFKNEERKHNIINGLEKAGEGSQISFVVDADSEDTKYDDGGCEARKAFFRSVFSVTDKEIFLFPNNKDDGDLEALLEKIIKEENRPVFECFEKYENCLKVNVPKIPRKPHLPVRKTKIYSYVNVLEGAEAADEGRRDYTNDNNWNLNHPELEPLVTFLTNFLSPIL